MRITDNSALTGQTSVTYIAPTMRPLQPTRARAFERRNRNPVLTEAIGKTPGRGDASDATGAPSKRHTLAVLRDTLAVTKPRLSSLVLVTTAGGMWLAPKALSWPVALLVLAATSVLVAGAQSLNSYLERDIDALMTRTARRPLPTGRLSPSVALWLGIIAAGASLPTLYFAANALTAILGAVAFVSYVAIYTPLKRHSTWALPVGAIPGAIPPAMGWAAASGRLDAAALALFGILFVWQLPHFFAIALYLRADYAKANVKVFTLVHGERATKVAIVLSSALLLPVTLTLVPLGVAGTSYAVASIVLGLGLLGYSLLGVSPHAKERWARRFFLATLVHLTLLFTVLALTAD